MPPQIRMNGEEMDLIVDELVNRLEDTNDRVLNIFITLEKLAKTTLRLGKM